MCFLLRSDVLGGSSGSSSQDPLLVGEDLADPQHPGFTQAQMLQCETLEMNALQWSMSSKFWSATVLLANTVGSFNEFTLTASIVRTCSNT